LKRDKSPSLSYSITYTHTVQQTVSGDCLREQSNGLIGRHRAQVAWKGTCAVFSFSVAGASWLVRNKGSPDAKRATPSTTKHECDAARTLGLRSGKNINPRKNTCSAYFGGFKPHLHSIHLSVLCSAPPPRASAVEIFPRRSRARRTSPPFFVGL